MRSEAEIYDGLAATEINSKPSFRSQQWHMLTCTVVCYIFYTMGRHNFSFAIPAIQDKFNINSTQTGIIAGAMLLSYGIGQAINGSLSEKLGARRLVSLGTVLSFILNICVSFSFSFNSFLIPWCLNGYAQSLGFAPGSRMITNWWGSDERGLAFGIYMFATGLSTVATFLVCICVLSYLSWEWLFRLPPLIMMIVGVGFFILARDKPEDLGYPPIAKVQCQDIDETNQLTFWQRLKLVVSNRYFMLACVAMGFCSVARYGLLFWAPVHYLDGSGDSFAMTYCITLSLPVGMSVGTLIVGDLADRYMKSNFKLSVMIFMLLGSLFSFILLFIPNNLVLVLVLFLAGLCIYGPQAALFAMCPKWIGDNLSATGVGVMNAVGYGFSAFSEPLIGAAIDWTGNTSTAFVIVSIACILTVLTVLLLQALESPELCNESSS